MRFSNYCSTADSIFVSWSLRDESITKIRIIRTIYYINRLLTFLDDQEEELELKASFPFKPCAGTARTSRLSDVMSQNFLSKCPTLGPGRPAHLDCLTDRPSISGIFPLNIILAVSIILIYDTLLNLLLFHV